jgi:hypothetical protein
MKKALLGILIGGRPSMAAIARVRCNIVAMNIRLLFVACALLPMAAAAETFRCGKWIIDDETVLEELMQKCGSPTSRESRVEDVRAPNVYTGGNNKVGETVIETWTYDLGPGKSLMVVTIVDGRIEKIDSKPK